MKKVVFFIYSILTNLSINAQQPPVFSCPTPPSVYSFTKYGDVPVNEYRGLADVSIPLYNVKLDEVNLPLKLNYFTGGVKVAEEASIVGLGWDMNIPSIIQTIKDRDDFDSTTMFTRLPDYCGNTFLPIRGNKHPLVVQNYNQNLSWYGMPYNGSSSNDDFLDQPVYFISCGNFVVVDNHYINSSGTYEEFIYDYHHINDSEADIFKVTVDGVELVFMRGAEGTMQNPQSLSEITSNPFRIINGREEYKVDLIGTDLSTNAGIKITSPSGTQYFFEMINTIQMQNGSELFLNYTNQGVISILNLQNIWMML